MTNYEKLISYLPSIYQKENNLKIIKSISILFDKFDEDFTSIFFNVDLDAFDPVLD